ncbi:MAG: ROK family protein [Xanthomonadales bacterium]|jgi:polyphosphate glucokinase|nr:ROK family protein [Xanthomonadales bacterium]
MNQLTLNTLSLDIGGSGIKGMVLDPAGTAVADRFRLPTPRPATPEAVLDTVVEVARHFEDDGSAYHRISVGFPGVVQFGVVSTGVNFDGDWSQVPLAREIEERTGKPCRAANDADIQGYGAIEGTGVEMVLTLGTGMGAAVFTNGHLVPNLELGHHPFADGKSYEEWVGDAAREQLGDARWSGWVLRAIETILPIWNPTRLYLGGGNTKHLQVGLPAGVTVVPNVAGILGGIRLWEDEGH